jgi:flavorubredoxin
VTGSIQLYLMQWGKSRAVNDAYHLDYPHETPFSKLSKSSGWAVSLPPLDDELHAAVDKAVSELKWHDEERHVIVVLSYIGGHSDSAIARALSKLRSRRVSQHAARTLRRQAENWLESKIIA